MVEEEEVAWVYHSVVNMLKITVLKSLSSLSFVKCYFSLEAENKSFSTNCPLLTDT